MSTINIGKILLSLAKMEDNTCTTESEVIAKIMLDLNATQRLQ
jgi:hypothetical protein